MEKIDNTQKSSYLEKTLEKEKEETLSYVIPALLPSAICGGLLGLGAGFFDAELNSNIGTLPWVEYFVPSWLPGIITFIVNDSQLYEPTISTKERLVNVGSVATASYAVALASYKITYPIFRYIGSLIK